MYRGPALELADQGINHAFRVARELNDLLLSFPATKLLLLLLATIQVEE